MVTGGNYQWSAASPSYRLQIEYWSILSLTTWPRVTTKRPSNVESLALILENNQTVHPAATGYDDMTQLDGSKTVLLSQFSRISILQQIRAEL